MQMIAAIRILALVAAYRERYGQRAAERLIAELARCNSSGLTQSLTSKFCAVEGCQNRAYGLNLYCPKHRLRYQRHGDPNMELRRGRKKRG